MNTRLTTLVGGFLLLLSTLTAQALPSIDTPKWGSVTFADDYRLDVEIADTKALRTYGLMDRQQLEESHGMLFVYPDDGVRSVWMKNTLLALDVLFLSSDGKIVSMQHNLQPCTLTPCPIYSSTADARYMLEVNAGFIGRHGLEIGQEVMLEAQHSGRDD